MKYWHIQMHLPRGRNAEHIDSAKMLKEDIPVIGTGEWDDFQCDNFKNETNKGLRKNDIILVRIGQQPIALCKVIDSVFFKNKELTLKYVNENFRKIEVLEWWDKGAFKFPDHQGTLKNLKTKNTTSYRFIDEWYNSIKKNKTMRDLIELLKQKKQVILQGPPGTGKTRLAKEIAQSMINGNSSSQDLSDVYIKKILENVDFINSATVRTQYKIVEVKDKKCTVALTDTNATYDISFNGIRKAYQGKLWEKGEQKGGLDPYNAAIAKYLYIKEEVTGQYHIVQFHPSYTYEDFVRGISVSNNDNQIEYKTENKTLGLLADKALKNYIDSKKDASQVSKEQWILEQFEIFKDSIIDKMDEESRYELNKTVNIIAVEEDAFRYTGNTWKNEFRMKYKDILHLYNNNISERAEVKKQADVSSLSKTHATYVKLVLDRFYTFMKDKEEPASVSRNIEEKNYVLIIDEINRANLSSVLGELIYALEYRGEAVDSMYDIDSNRSITLPPNLYIIGTMNTADRSVGYIDYAIRRRFAFVNVLPKVLDESNLEGKKFALDKFKQVSKLFISNENIEEDIILQPSDYLSEEFKPEDIWLGHSYFIYEEENFDIQLKYEIIPILKEYVKDGILKESALEIINSL